MKLKLLVLLLSFPLLSCCQNKGNSPIKTDKQYEAELIKREHEAAAKIHSAVGQDVGTFTFEVTTKDPIYQGGVIPWASLESPQRDVPNLIGATDIIIPEKKITVIIDYPLTKEYSFELESATGFTRKDLLLEISKYYYLLYKEEEETATIKTIDMEKRTMYNCNETNGKYGIWGHDIADLVLTEVYIYKTNEGKIVVTMGVDS